MRTISYGLAHVYWARILLTALLVGAFLTVALAPALSMSSVAHHSWLFDLLRALQPSHASSHLLVAGGPPPPIPCGGGVATHC